MSIHLNNLTFHAVACINAMHLPHPQDREIVENCISRYDWPCTTFGEALNWLIYRITNAIKSLWGQSDWQIAERTVSSNASVIARATLSRKLDGSAVISLSHQLRTTLESRADYLATRAAKNLLKECWRVQNYPLCTLEERESFSLKLLELDLVYAMNDQIGSIVDEVFNPGIDNLAEARAVYMRSRSTAST